MALELEAGNRTVERALEHLGAAEPHLKMRLLLDVASGHAEDYYVLRFDLSCDRSIPADSELVIGQFDTALDVTVQIQISLAEYLASDFYTTVNNGRSGPRERGFSSGQVDALPFPQDLHFGLLDSRKFTPIWRAPTARRLALEGCETEGSRVVRGAD